MKNINYNILMIRAKIENSDVHLQYRRVLTRLRRRMLFFLTKYENAEY